MQPTLYQCIYNIFYFFPQNLKLFIKQEPQKVLTDILSIERYIFYFSPQNLKLFIKQEPQKDINQHFNYGKIQFLFLPTIHKKNNTIIFQ